MKVLIGSELSASGWHLGDVRGGIRNDKQAAAAWLSRDTAAEFAPQPWHELANVYERNGQPADARWLRRKAAQGVTRVSPWWSKPIRWIYGALTGHGYNPLLAAAWLLLAIVASGIIVAANAAVFTPTAANKVAWKTPPPVEQPAPPITGATPCDELQDRSTCLRPFFYGFDNALPGPLATGQAALGRQRRPRMGRVDSTHARFPQDRQLDPRRTPPRRCNRTPAQNLGERERRA
jgi:hypothetical protein